MELSPSTAMATNAFFKKKKTNECFKFEAPVVIVVVMAQVIKMIEKKIIINLLDIDDMLISYRNFTTKGRMV